MSQKTKVIKIAIPIIIIVAGFFIMKTLVSKRPLPQKEARKDPGMLVEILKTERENSSVIVRGTGIVEASQKVSIIPQVSGSIVYAAPNLEVGGFFQKDEMLMKLEESDYSLAVERAMSAKAKAEYDLATIESRAEIARSEWERINKEKDSVPNPLVLFGPQLKSAKSALASALAQVEQAKINLGRTKIEAPFNARVRSENVDIGQYVRSGTSVAVLAGTDTAEIAVPFPLHDLQWLDVPRHGERQNGADASVRLNIGEKSYSWKGSVVRSTGEIDPGSRMMQIIVEVRDPYGLKGEEKSTSPSLAVGTFVEVYIKGRMLKDVFIIPRTALRDNSTVWVMDEENRLRIKNVGLLRTEKEKIIIGEGLADGDMVILTNISGAADGMKLRRINK